MQVQVQVGEGVSGEHAHAARERLAGLDRDGDLELTGGRLSLSRTGVADGEALYAADASVVLDGRRLAAYATGETALDAADRAAGQLTRQVERQAGRDGRILVPRKWVAWARAARRGWDWRDDVLVREFRFRDFDEGMRFLERLARRAEDHKRHPDMCISANRVRLTIANPHRAGITLAELRIAAKVNAVVEDLGATTSGRGLALGPARPKAPTERTP